MATFHGDFSNSVSEIQRNANEFSGVVAHKGAEQKKRNDAFEVGNARTVKSMLEEVSSLRSNAEQS
jgi:hypothetical protein